MALSTKFITLENVINAKKLKSLALIGNIKYEIDDLVNMQILSITRNNLLAETSLDLTKLTNLERLEIADNGINSISGLEIVENLKYFKLSEEPLRKGSMPIIKVNEQLVQLDYNYYESTSGWVIPNNLPKCNYFSAVSTALNESNIEKLVDAIYANLLEQGQLRIDGATNASVINGSPTYVKIQSLIDDRGWAVSYNYKK